MDDFSFTFNFRDLFDKNAFIDSRSFFKAELAKINEKYKDFFKERMPLLANLEPDNIFNHCIIYTHRDTVKFYFSDNLIPENIQKECFDVYEKVCMK